MKNENLLKAERKAPKLAKTNSGAVCGVDATPIEIEISTVEGGQLVTIVGLPDQAVKESKDRVLTALGNSGFKPLRECVTINLAPADVRKEGPIYDLPIAVTLLAVLKQFKCSDFSDFAMVGELALSGEVRRVRGVLPIALKMRDIGKRGILVPMDNAREASVVEGLDVYPVRTLREAVDFLGGVCDITPVSANAGKLVMEGVDCGEDFADVKGQEVARRAIEVAVAGGHNILMVGSPGSGKTMLSRRIPSILPPLTVEEALEVTRIHSVAGMLRNGEALMVKRPFRAPHHTVSDAGLLGGGSHPSPGEVSLAHRGVLFLDEFPEFHRNVLEVLRQPLEDGYVTISRVAATCDFPSRFMLVAAMNPCPCGFANDPNHQCRCSHRMVQNYRSRISGPLLDRIDIQLDVQPVKIEELQHMQGGESSAEIRKRVIAAREIQKKRFDGILGVHCNAEMRAKDLMMFCNLDTAAQQRMKNVIKELDLSARAYERVLKVGRTIADLAGSESVLDEHIYEASSYRSLDRSYWG
jgi:magnesium chelatase family protein